MMCARRCDSAARVELPFKFTATLVRHSSTNSASVRPILGGNFRAAALNRNRAAIRLPCLSVEHLISADEPLRLSIPFAPGRTDLYCHQHDRRDHAADGANKQLVPIVEKELPNGVQ